MNRTGEQLEKLMLELDQFHHDTADREAEQVAGCLREMVGALSSLRDMSDEYSPGYARQLARFVRYNAKLTGIVMATKSEQARIARGPDSTDTDG